MNMKYGARALISKIMIQESMIDVVAYTRDNLAHDVLSKIMEEHDISKVVIAFSTKEYDIEEKPYNPNTINMSGYKEISVEARVSDYARLR